MKPPKFAVGMTVVYQHSLKTPHVVSMEWNDGEVGTITNIYRANSGEIHKLRDMHCYRVLFQQHGDWTIREDALELVKPIKITVVRKKPTE